VVLFWLLAEPGKPAADQGLAIGVKRGVASAVDATIVGVELRVLESGIVLAAPAAVAVTLSRLGFTKAPDAFCIEAYASLFCTANASST
jgi:hypothetical protein